MLYLLIGLVFGIYFVAKKIAEFDDAAKGAGFGFKLIIFLGTIPLWPFVAARIIMGGDVPAENNPHRRAAKEHS